MECYPVQAWYCGHIGFGGPEITFSTNMVIAAHAKRESRHAISRAKSENFSGFQIYKISITLPICIATESVSQSFYKYSFF